MYHNNQKKKWTYLREFNQKLKALRTDLIKLPDDAPGASLGVGTPTGTPKAVKYNKTTLRIIYNFGMINLSNKNYL